MSKRSRRVTPAIIGSVISLSLLAGCGEEQVEAAVFETVAQCAASGEYSQAECEQYFNEAQAAHQEAAPQYANSADCESEFGAGRCAEGPELSADSGTAVRHHSYVPLAAGIMIGAAISQPLYRTYMNGRYGAFMTHGGATVANGVGRTRVSRSMAVTRPVRSTTTLSRGGFGSRASRASS
ncbi:MAG: hypothetical protein CVV27_16715 [Candidatus Melainabacteria bacterium HGW-Melainabacteria-1]|nr:MAG: hypothetical protein CVV27_16715 [Candidatus Melainabacteria bacterium HGW-Melainabacteria-1]